MEFVVAILAGTLIFLLFSVFIIVYIRIYWKRKVLHAQEVSKMKQLFNEELLKSRLEIKEETLNNVSHEIHDNVGQMLTLAKVQLNLIEHNQEADKEKLAELKDTLGQAMTDLRNIAKNLNSEKVQLSSLPESIASHVSRITKTGITDISMTIEGTEQKIDDQKKLILFRMLQEGLQNIIKHSNATRVHIGFNYKSSCLDITISDNGIGFDVNEMAGKNDGLGLQNIMSRAALIGGRVTISSAAGKGTNMLITTPYA
jgi:two-component system, NarL family, sensor kinase